MVNTEGPFGTFAIPFMDAKNILKKCRHYYRAGFNSSSNFLCASTRRFIKKIKSLKISVNITSSKLETQFEIFQISPCIKSSIEFMGTAYLIALTINQTIISSLGTC